MGPADLILFTLSWVNRAAKSQILKHLIQATNRTKSLHSVPPAYSVWQVQRHVSTKGLSALTSKVSKTSGGKARLFKSAYCVVTYNGLPRPKLSTRTKFPLPGISQQPGSAVSYQSQGKVTVCLGSGSLHSAGWETQSPYPCTLLWPMQSLVDRGHHWMSANGRSRENPQFGVLKAF